MLHFGPYVVRFFLFGNLGFRPCIGISYKVKDSGLCFGDCLCRVRGLPSRLHKNRCNGMQERAADAAISNALMSEGWHCVCTNGSEFADFMEAYVD